MSQQKKDHMIVLKLENMHVTDTNMTEEDDEEVDPGLFLEYSLTVWLRLFLESRVLNIFCTLIFMIVRLQTVAYSVNEFSALLFQQKNQSWQLPW